jgi:hypothetical protein
MQRLFAANGFAHVEQQIVALEGEVVLHKAPSQSVGDKQNLCHRLAGIDDPMNTAEPAINSGVICTRQQQAQFL